MIMFLRLFKAFNLSFQKKILGAKGGSSRYKKIETTVYQSNTSIFHKSLDLLISSIINNNNNNNNNKAHITYIELEAESPGLKLTILDKIYHYPIYNILFKLF